MSGTYNILFAGVGGQGVISAAGILARCAIASGLEARMYGSYGMAQRGGMVSAHLRIGENVLNARIERGQAHLLIGLELTEAVRLAHFLSSEGFFIVSDLLVPPVGKMMKDGGRELQEFLRSLPNVVVLDSQAFFGPAGSRGLNAALLGAASAVKGFPVGRGSIEEFIQEEAGSRSGILLEAFRKGREHMARPER